MCSTNNTQKIVGSEVVRLDGTDKVTGRTKFSGDLKMNGMCYAKLVHLPATHANILKIDPSEAERYPGVVCVTTAKDIPGVNRHGLITKDQQCICDEKVRYAGDFVAVVVAETEEIAAEAVKLVHVDYEALPVYRTPEEATAPDAVPFLLQTLLSGIPGAAIVGLVLNLVCPRRPEDKVTDESTVTT